MSKRKKVELQQTFDFTPSNLEVTNEFYAKYEKISWILGENPEIVAAVHKDLQDAYGEERDGQGGRD